MRNNAYNSIINHKNLNDLKELTEHYQYLYECDILTQLTSCYKDDPMIEEYNLDSAEQFIKHLEPNNKYDLAFYNSGLIAGYKTASQNILNILTSNKDKPFPYT